LRLVAIDILAYWLKPVNLALTPISARTKRVCEKGQNWCPFVLSVNSGQALSRSKDERIGEGGSTSSPRTGIFWHIL
jgi:hypothetical protein